MGPCFFGFPKSDAIESDMRATHGIGTIHTALDDVMKSMTVVRKELHQRRHDLNRYTHVVGDIKRVAHVDVIPNPHMLVPAVDVGTRDDGRGKQVRAERSESEGTMIFEEPSQASQARQRIAVHHVRQELLVLYNDGGHLHPRRS
jgi:hypothetical protein